MYCRNCGKEIVEEAIFCNHCGTKVKQELVEEVKEVVAIEEENIEEEIMQKEVVIEELPKMEEDEVEDINHEREYAEEMTAFIESTNEESKEDTIIVEEETPYFIDLKGFNKYRGIIVKILAAFCFILETIWIIGFVGSIYQDFENDTVYKLIIYMIRFLVYAGEVGVITFIPNRIKEMLKIKKKNVMKRVTLKEVFICNVIMLILEFGFYNNLKEVDYAKGIGIFAIALKDDLGDQIASLFELFDKAVIFFVILIAVYFVYQRFMVKEEEE